VLLRLSSSPRSSAWSLLVFFAMFKNPWFHSNSSDDDDSDGMESQVALQALHPTTRSVERFCKVCSNTRLLCYSTEHDPAEETTMDTALSGQSKNPNSPAAGQSTKLLLVSHCLRLQAIGEASYWAVLQCNPRRKNVVAVSSANNLRLHPMMGVSRATQKDRVWLSIRNAEVVSSRAIRFHLSGYSFVGQEPSLKKGRKNRTELWLCAPKGLSVRLYTIPEDEYAFTLAVARRGFLPWEVMHHILGFLQTEGALRPPPGRSL